MKVKTIISRLLDLIFPPKCTFCEAILPNYDTGLCPTCQANLPWLLSSNHALQKGEFFTLCVAPLHYDSLVRESFQRYKFSSLRIYAPFYASFMTQSVKDHLPLDFDLVTWVPLHPKRKRTRGFDQAQLLAKPISKELDFPLLSTLKKQRNAQAQSTIGTDPSVRRANVLGCYSCTAPSQVVGKKILLVDDIHTTGSTLSECSRVLLTAGASEVHCVTLAHANLQKN